MIDFLMFVTVARGIRRFIESRQKLAGKRQASEVSAFPALRTPSDDFHDHVWLPLCQRVAELAETRMRRPLTADERRAVWRARSKLVLEVMLKELGEASPGAAAALLKNAPSGLDRPDPTGWCELGP